MYTISVKAKSQQHRAKHYFYEIDVNVILED